MHTSMHAYINDLTHYKTNNIMVLSGRRQGHRHIDAGKNPHFNACPFHQTKYIVVLWGHR